MAEKTVRFLKIKSDEKQPVHVFIDGDGGEEVVECTLEEYAGLNVKNSPTPIPPKSGQKWSYSMMRMVFETDDVNKEKVKKPKKDDCLMVDEFESAVLFTDGDPFKGEYIFLGKDKYKPSKIDEETLFTKKDVVESIAEAKK